MADTVGHDDNAFGPQHGSNFDFTLTFESAILTIVPTSLLIVLFPFLLYRYTHQPVLVKRSWLSWAKVGAAACAACIELSGLVLWTQPSTGHSVFTVAASSMSLVAAICVAVILDFAHRHALRGSSIISFYLTLSLIFDITRARSCFMRDGLSIQASLLATTAALKGCILVMEEMSNRAQILDPTVRQTAGSESTSGFWNRSVFFWLNKTLVIGFSKVLELEDLEDLGPEFSSTDLSNKFTAVWVRIDKTSRYCLLKTLLTVLAEPFLASVVPKFCYTVVYFTLPLFLKRLIEFVTDSESKSSPNEARGLIGATVLIFMVIAISKAIYSHLSYRFVTLARGVLVSQILMKCLTMDYVEANNHSAMTLMSTDIEGLVAGLPEIHDLWLCFVQVGIGIYLLTTIIGRASFLVAIPIIPSTGLALLVGRRIMATQSIWNEKVQQRVSKTIHVYKNIKGIKMLGFESAVANYLQNIRVNEINLSKPFRFWTAVNLLIMLFMMMLTPVIVIAGALFWSTSSGTLNVAEAYTTLSIVWLIAGPLMVMIKSYSMFASMVACIQRIQKFLLLEDLIDRRIRDSDVEFSRLSEKAQDSTSDHAQMSMVSSTGGHAIHLNHICIKSQLEDRFLLQDVSFTMPRSSLSIMVGPVGSGKSVLLRALLGEVNFQGSMYVDAGAIAYCDQTPWIQNCSIRDNITGENHFNPTWYEQVLDACLLQEDLNNIVDGDESFAGSDGIHLSGGQKQRVALARALYARAPIYVLDDVLSGLDKTSAEKIASNLFGPNGMLRMLRATVIMATHTAYCVHFADQLLILDGVGRVETQANSAQRSHMNSRTLAVLHDLESSVVGIPDQAAGRHETLAKEKADEIAFAQEDTLRRKGDAALYMIYFRSAKKWMVVLWLALCVLSGVTETFPVIYYRIWLGVDPNNLYYFAGYAGVAVLACVVGTGMNWFFYAVLVPESSSTMHKMLVDSMMGATLSFLTTEGSGAIINRFSQDMSILSQNLPRAALQLFYYAAIALTNLGAAASGASYAGSIVPFILLLVYVVQHYYLRTSRQMRFLDLEAKTPLYTYIAESTSGLCHIRSYGTAASVLEYGLELLDTSQQPFYYMFCIQRWLSLVMDIVGAIMSVFLVSLAVLLPQTATPPGFGLAMLTMFVFGVNLAILVEKWTAIETSLGAIARLRSFVRDTPMESDRSSVGMESPQYWPHAGNIVLRNVSATYSSTDVPNRVLVDVSINIPAGEKVGIVGRTGSGKSSLILVLLNFLDFTGSIHIDGVDITKLSFDDLRQHITTIPQDPVEFDGSIRQNLLPFSNTQSNNPSSVQRLQSTDIEAIDALTEVLLWDYVSSRGGLDAQIADMAFSSGQKQLLSIARAILQNRNSVTRVVLMDEPTSNMDVETERHIQRVMAKVFGHCTVLCVAHRLETIQDVDMIIEMDEGAVTRVSRLKG